MNICVIKIVLSLGEHSQHQMKDKCLTYIYCLRLRTNKLRLNLFM